MSPVRVRRSRQAGARLPEGAVYVGRPTRWGNPYRVGVECSVSVDDGELLHDGLTLRVTPEISVALYRDNLEGLLEPPTSDHPEDVADRQELVDALAELAGHDLACWCPLDAPCHADVLLEIANQPEGT